MRTTQTGRPADVIVIGAGAAGLAAAGALARHGLNVTVLEARDRTGGRVLSVRPPGWPVPVELGAEFVHGGSESLRRMEGSAGFKHHAVNVPMWWHENDLLQAVPDFWSRIGRVAARIPARDRGWSFARFLRECRAVFPSVDRRMTAHYISGFNAGPLDEISALAQRAARAGTLLEDFKLEGRYDALLQAMQAAWPRERVRLHLRNVVQGVEWKAGRVTVHVRDRRQGGMRIHQARAVIITLPLGVLRARQVRFVPPLAARQKLIARLGWGHAVRVVLRLKPGFWSAPFLPPALRGRGGRNFGFINAPAQPMPTWWALACPAPVLTGWAGGDDARRLERLPARRIRDAALCSLAAILGTTMRELRRWLVGLRRHDWTRDPFARGAYSFAKAGVEDGPRRLAEPVRGTLFFAGEATSDNLGTVSGAVDSGLRAAREAHRALRRPHPRRPKKRTR